MCVWMLALDSFISPIPGFEGDIPIPAIPVSTRYPSSESASDLSVGAGAGASKTQTGKRKSAATLTPQKKSKKVTGKSSTRIKINEPTRQALFLL
jgi:hypothetical protein